MINILCTKHKLNKIKHKEHQTSSESPINNQKQSSSESAAFPRPRGATGSLRPLAAAIAPRATRFPPLNLAWLSTEGMELVEAARRVEESEVGRREPALGAGSDCVRGSKSLKLESIRSRMCTGGERPSGKYGYTSSLEGKKKISTQSKDITRC
jgi:hypothetical protein